MEQLAQLDVAIRRTSLFTEMQLHPGVTLALGIAAAALVLPLVMGGRGNGNGRSERRSVH